MNKELIDLKKWQVSETVGRNEQSNKIMEAWNEQRGYMEGMSKQMKNWTRNASARECYDIWAHQQLNPNLVEMPVTKLVRLIYGNCDKKRPAFLGCLKSITRPEHHHKPHLLQPQLQQPLPPPLQHQHLHNNMIKMTITLNNFFKNRISKQSSSSTPRHPAPTPSVEIPPSSSKPRISTQQGHAQAPDNPRLAWGSYSRQKSSSADSTPRRQ
ncbi:hypothetical protein PIB30_085075, partial [Stylosanthes scabra]|nr:hypothetical protein [Stylosanthes scabra]